MKKLLICTLLFLGISAAAQNVLPRFHSNEVQLLQLDKKTKKFTSLGTKEEHTFFMIKSDTLFVYCLECVNQNRYTFSHKKHFNTTNYKDSVNITLYNVQDDLYNNNIIFMIKSKNNYVVSFGLLSSDKLIIFNHIRIINTPELEIKF